MLGSAAGGNGGTSESDDLIHSPPSPSDSMSPKSQEYLNIVEDPEHYELAVSSSMEEEEELEEMHYASVTRDQLENVEPSNIPSIGKKRQGSLVLGSWESTATTVIGSLKLASSSRSRKASSSSTGETPMRLRFKLKQVSDQLKQQAHTSLNSQVLKSRGIGAFCSGSRFSGNQISARQSYQVNVELKYVDIENDFACGYINIKGLTDESSELTTCFEAEIIGKRHPFLTGKWEADSNIDFQHWSKFPAFEPVEQSYHTDGFSHDNKNTPFIFMRWKEHFLVPDHHVKSITGASFDGFYYICFEVATGKINGFYFHHNSEWFQRLQLQHVPHRSFDCFEYR